MKDLNFLWSFVSSRNLLRQTQLICSIRPLPTQLNSANSDLKESSREAVKFKEFFTKLQYFTTI
jgi:hypothetical protein